MTLPRIASLSSYGGAKTNLSPVEDYSTDEDASDRNNYVADVAGMTHTACRAWRSFVTGASAASEPPSNAHDSNWGNAPGVLSSAVRSAVTAGQYVVTWPATVTDELGNVSTLNIRRAWASIEGGIPGLVTVQVSGANSVTVNLFNPSGTANDLAGSIVTVFFV